MTNIEDLRAHSKVVMEKHAKTFSRASLFFAPAVREDARLLYFWCRFCDDYIDLAQNSTEAKHRADELLSRTLAVFENSPLNAKSSGASRSDVDQAFIALKYLVDKYSIPSHYPIELIQGMISDAHFKPFNEERELKLYCYRVASVVGLMMCHLMGLSRLNALSQAADLGIAMQLTNMARDIYEDYNIRRVYAPRTWWDDPKEELSEPELELLHPIISKKFVAEAQNHYDSAARGLSALPFRSALAVACAIELYSAIGLQVLKLTDWKQRAYVSKTRKLILILKGLIRAVTSRSILPSRWFKQTPLTQVRTFDENIQIS